MNIISDKTNKFTDLYSDFYSMVYHGIYAKIRDADLSGDLTQEVFTRFYEKMDEVEYPRKWLLGTLRFVLLEHYQKNRAGTVDIDEIFYDENILFVNGFRDTRIVLREAFDASENYRDEKDRIIYELIAIKKYTREEVSRLMGLTKKQVHYKYKAVVDRIVEYLKKKGINKLEELL
jgi:RNA polymerase sigma factor (sigma-70 family)